MIILFEIVLSFNSLLFITRDDFRQDDHDCNHVKNEEKSVQ